MNRTLVPAHVEAAIQARVAADKLRPACCAECGHALNERDRLMHPCANDPAVCRECCASRTAALDDCGDCDWILDPANHRRHAS